MKISYTAIYLLVSILWLVFFKKYSKTLNYPLLFSCFTTALILGPVSGFITHTLSQNLIQFEDQSDLFQEFLIQFFAVGPVEETFKFLIALFFMLRRDKVKSILDSVMLSISVALGFAAGENILYLISYGVELTLPRLLLGNLGHAAYSLYWGYALGAVLTDKAPLKMIVTGLFIASLVHGLYNFVLVFSVFGAILALIISILSVFLLFRLIRFEKTYGK